MKLAQLLSIYKELHLGENANKDVASLCVDSRKFQSGDVWIALRGQSFDGHSFIAEACNSGAIAIIAEDVSSIPSDYAGAVVKVPSTRTALNKLASHYYGDPVGKLFCVGITGTNGKTTTAYMVECVLSAFGLKTGVMGTIDHHFEDHRWESELTTPDTLTLQKRLSEFVTLGAKATAFEVSSHALVQKRAHSVEFDVVIFTNLSRDHLDYHKTMEDYLAAKEILFKELAGQSRRKTCRAIINISDEWGVKLKVAENCSVWSFGEVKSQFQFQVTKSTFEGSEFHLECSRGSFDGSLQVPGKHNVYNAISAMLVGLQAGASVETCLEALKKFKGVPGRLEPVENKASLHIFVDYSHTEAALETALDLLLNIRQLSHSNAKIHVVFGCGGDRDKGKRPNMGLVAVEKSDHVYITSDNPRTEDPDKIILDIIEGIPQGSSNKKVHVDPDRRRAIEAAIVAASPGDVILIAGKGHEDYQITGEIKVPFSDVQVAREIANNGM